MHTTLRTELPEGFDIAEAHWARYVGTPRFSYPIDYSVAVVDADLEAGRIDFLVRWAPDAYCHYHRHLGSTAAVVIEGEQHITEARELETVTKVRRAGFTGQVPDGETHMECAGPDGLTMLFRTHAPDGRLFQVLDEDGNVITEATIAEFVERTRELAAR
jgi:hypothetical protein